MVPWFIITALIEMRVFSLCSPMFSSFFSALSPFSASSSANSQSSTEILSLLIQFYRVWLRKCKNLILLFRVPVDPLEWQISQDTANSIVAWLANTIGAAESVLRVAATGHDKRLFFKVLLLIGVS